MIKSAPIFLPISARSFTGSDRMTLAAPARFRTAAAPMPMGPLPQMTTLSPGRMPPPHSITAL